MNLEDIKTPEDILKFMSENIKYGWLDINNEVHLWNMQNFRKLYRTSTIDEVLECKCGTCIEQVYLMHKLLEMINIPSKMFCTRIYEDENYEDLESEEHMHCFVLYYLNGIVYQIEHPNFDKKGIYEFENEDVAIDSINTYYTQLSGSIIRNVTQFYEVKPNLSFKEFNIYINNLDRKKGL